MGPLLRDLDRRAAALLLGAGILLAVYAGLAFFVALDHTAHLDRGVRAWVQPMRQAGLALTMEWVSVLGDETGLIPMILGASLVLWRRDRRWAVLLPLFMAGTGALQFAAKWLADRPRPNETPWGFPSGHVLSLAVFLGLVIYVVCLATGPSSRGRRWRLPACLLAAGTLAAVAFSRIYLDMHWLSDVGGGFAIGIAYLLLGIWAADRWPILAAPRPQPVALLADEREPDLGREVAVEPL